MPAAKTRRLHHRRLSPVPAFRTPTAPPADGKAPGHTPNPPASGGPCDRGTREQGGGPSGPRTPEGKAVSARNATTHGLFARQAVLPHLGESADGYKALLDALTEQFDPRTLMERQYLELWAEASWKMRRLARLEADVWEDPQLDRAERLTQLEKLARLQNMMRRQLDKALRMLHWDVPETQAHYARRAVMACKGVTEGDVAASASLAYDIAAAVQAEILSATSPRLDPARLDNAPQGDTPQTKKCQNEPPAPAPAQAGSPLLPSPGVQPWAPDAEKCRNEPASLVLLGSHLALSDSAGIAGRGSSPRGT